MDNQQPTLYIVATPLGHLQDITLRALEVLRTVDYIFAEDTRVSIKLLKKYDVKTPLRSLREASTPAQWVKVRSFLEVLPTTASVAFVSDAGTPGVSDPGNKLVSVALEARYNVVPIPGAAAVSTVMSIAGALVQRPFFLGFLPKKKGHQTLIGKSLLMLTDDVCDSLVFYESPERIVKLLNELQTVSTVPLWGCLGRELTKMHEEILRGPISELYTELSTRKQVKGEIVLLVQVLHNQCVSLPHAS